MGEYSLTALATDTLGNSAASSAVNITVVGPVAQIGVTPTSATVAAGGTQRFTATASDMLGHALDPQPTFSWSVSGGGTIDGSGLFTAGSSAGGPFSVVASSGGITGTASVSVAASGSGTFIGNHDEGISSDNIWDKGAWINATRFRPTTDLIVTTMLAKVGAISGSYKCAIYADAGGKPSAFLRGTSEVSTPSSGWQVFPLTSPLALTSGSYYWLAIWSDDANARVYYSGNNGVLRWGAYSYGTWPNPIITTGGSSLNYCIYATGIATSTLASIAVTPANPTISSPGSQQFMATGTYSDGSTQNITNQVTWASSSTAVATVNASGLVTAVSPGTTTISATLAGKIGSSTLTVQAIRPVTITTTSLSNGTVSVVYSATLTASGGTTPYTWAQASGTLPPGLMLNPSSGAITGTPSTTGTFNFTVQVSDDGNPMQTASKSLSITIASVPTSVSIWPSTAMPGLVDGGPDSSVELGVKFRSDVAGTITGIRFYKAIANGGTHTGSLWTTSGTRLATATFTGETASGWQQVNFATPVALTPNTVYVASYHASNGHYSADVNYFSSRGVDNPPLHALANNVSGGNGVYRYGRTTGFPNQTWKAANYWVDVVFTPAAQ